MTDNTIFDSVFKTILNKLPQLLIPLVNEAFGRDYPADAEIVPFNSEHQTPKGARIADSVFRLQDRVYHVECQTTPDADMILRMIEYDFAIALDEALIAGAPYEMNFPESCVLFLRHTRSTPDKLVIKMNMPGGESVDYGAQVIKAQDFTSDELFEKHLLLLLPYYLMRYERDLAQIAADDARTARLLAECAELRVRLESATLPVGETLLYEELTTLIIKVSDYLLDAQEPLRKKVRGTMGGEVLELMSERAERLAREAREQGLEQGREQGREQGLEQGLEQGREQGLEQGLEQGREQTMLVNLQNLMQSTGCDIDAAMDMLKIPEDSRQALTEKLRGTTTS